MEIRQKLTYQFAASVALFLMVSMLVIYFSFYSFRKDEFKDRLMIKARSVAQIIAETDRLDQNLLKRLELNNPTSLPRESVIVYDVDGQTLYVNGAYDSLKAGPDIILKIKESGELFYTQSPYEVYGFHYIGKREEVTVVCGAIDIFGLRKLRKLRLILFSVYMVSIIFVYLLGRIFAARALAPIAQVIKQVDEMDINNLDSRVLAGSGSDEITKLAATFNHLLERLEGAIQLQKDFISNASHELRTPLTVITGQLEVSLLKDRPGSEYKTSMISVLEEIKRLNSLTNKLLILSRAGKTVTIESFDTVRIDEVLWLSRSEVMTEHPGFTIAISFDDTISGEDQLNIYGNKQLLTSAFSNLIENGCKYSSDHSIDIRLLVKDDELQIKFIDKGIGIPEEDTEFIFQPFFRGSNVEDNPGHGIGLSLVERITLLHRGSIVVHSKPGEGSSFILNLPLLQL